MTRRPWFAALLSVVGCGDGEPMRQQRVVDGGRVQAREPDGGGSRPVRDGQTTPIGETCAEANIIATRRPLTVWFALDDALDLTQASPAEPLGPAWGVIRQTLLGEDGVITQLEDAVRFGWIAVGIPMDGYCEQPKKTFVDPALQNHAAISAAYVPMGDRSENIAAPYYALKHVLEHTRATPPSERGKSVMIVARGPNNDYICHVDYLANYMLGDNPSGAGVAYRIGDKAIADLVAEGVGVYAFGAVLATGNAWVERAAQIAELGGTGRGPIEWRTPDDLRAELVSLAGDLIGCEFELNGSVQAGDECYGSVSVDGRALRCNDADGWRMKDARTVELTGAACAALKQEPAARFEADFPCEAWVPLL